MPKCIYCLRNNNETSFNDKEHVLPKCLGIFEPLNLTIRGNFVCDNCNHKVFSNLETQFKEDSHEGIYGQMLNLEGNRSVRIRNKNVKIECSPGIGDDFYKDIFPFLKIQDGEFVVEIKPQIKIKNPNGGFQVFLSEALDQIPKNSREFNEIKNRLKVLKDRAVAIFIPTNSPDYSQEVNKVERILQKFNFKYNEKMNRFTKLTKSPTRQFKINLDVHMNVEYARVLAKIALNYFLYCAIQDRMGNILFKSEFDRIREFIVGKKIVRPKEILLSINENNILYDESVKNKRVIAHMLTFEIENENIIAKETLFGNNIYKILIGKASSDLIKSNFGCGHLFDPFTRKIYNLVKPPPTLKPKEIKPTFGLFKKSLPA